MKPKMIVPAVVATMLLLAVLLVVLCSAALIGAKYGYDFFVSDVLKTACLSGGGIFAGTLTAMLAALTAAAVSLANKKRHSR